MKQYKKWIWNGLFCAALFAVTFWYIFRRHDFAHVWALIREAQPEWCALGVALVLGFILSESYIIWYLMRAIGQKAQLTHCILYSFVGFFFSAITPSASGGQPAQVYFMKKDRIPLSVAIPVLTVVTVLYKLVLIVLSAVVLIFRPANVMRYLSPSIGWVWLGLGLNAAFVAGLLLLMFRPNAAHRGAYAVIRLYAHLFRHADTAKLCARVDAGIEKYTHVTECFARNTLTVLRAFIFTLLQRVALFSVTWCCCMAYRLHYIRALTVTTLQAMIAVSADMMPLPGGTGISEALFMQVFDEMFGRKLTLPIMLLSRGISYYAQILFGAVFTVAAVLIIGHKKKGIEKE